MKELSSHERFKRIFEHKEADRIPIFDGFWTTTIERWQREGMPKDVNILDYLGLDRVERIILDVSPRYDAKVLEETEDYKICVTDWGVTRKEWKHKESTPQFLNHTIVDKSIWLKTKKRIAPTLDRIPWKYIKKNYKKWRKEGYWIQARLWFGFDVTHAWVVGTERLLIAFIEDPDWCRDMFDHLLETNLALLDRVWNEGYQFDSIFWPDDMGYKHNQFFSIKMYREILKPYHKRAIEWAHQKKIKAHLHSCGDVNPFVTELVDMGLDALNPLEVKAGMDPIALKQKFGDKLVLHGGINAVLWDDKDAIEEEMRRVIPMVKESGGYIFSSDHSVPSTVSLENFKYIINLAKELGRY